MDADAADEDAPILSASQAAALCTSASIWHSLEDSRMMEALRYIDSACTREAALARLERALEDPDFERFSLQALDTIGWTAASDKAGVPV